MRPLQSGKTTLSAAKEGNSFLGPLSDGGCVEQDSASRLRVYWWYKRTTSPFQHRALLHAVNRSHVYGR
ncbi:hypothetical protein EK904_000657 [Melospiza melodia maxima]|nr:hypothetical protein EK904_000657 [Melospiza melodia maxima]